MIAPPPSAVPAAPPRGGLHGLRIGESCHNSRVRPRTPVACRRGSSGVPPCPRRSRRPRPTPTPSCATPQGRDHRRRQGGRPGRWSARKAQLLAAEYEKAGGGYHGPATEGQAHLKQWTAEEWTTQDGTPADRGEETARYLPKKAWEELTPEEAAETEAAKREGSRAGAPNVPQHPGGKGGTQARVGQSKAVGAEEEGRRLTTGRGAAPYNSPMIELDQLSKTFTAPTGELLYAATTSVSPPAPAKSSASSAPTARARPPPCGCSAPS